MNFIFKVCVNVKSEDDIIDLLSYMDDHLCLGKIIPRDPIGLCLGVINIDVDGEEIKLAIWMVNEKVDRPWVRLGGTSIDFDASHFQEILEKHAHKLMEETWGNV